MKPIATWHWFRNMVAPTANPSDGAYLYAEGGVMKVRQSDGQVVPIVASTATTQIWTGGTSNTVYTNNTPRINCGGSS
jgi:hypothetical protein